MVGLAGTARLRRKLSTCRIGVLHLYYGVSQKVKQASVQPFMEQGLPVEFLRDPSANKEEMARAIATQRGVASGLGLRTQQRGTQPFVRTQRHSPGSLLQKAHARIANQRTDFHHKLSRNIVNDFGLIAVENLNVKGLASGMLAKSVHDAGWSQFLSYLTYKAANAGRELVKVDPRGTSQTCTCGARVPKRLQDRWHSCPACGLSAGRDSVSSHVILNRAGNRPSVANVEVSNSRVGREAVCFS